jgi:tRNA dimethylallyltransferase
LVARHGRGLRALGAVGYREVVGYLDQRLTFAQLEPAIASATKKYARRQRTWFRKEEGVTFYPDADALFEAERPR